MVDTDLAVGQIQDTSRIEEPGTVTDHKPAVASKVPSGRRLTPPLSPPKQKSKAQKKALKQKFS